MCEIIILIFGIIALVRGKFSLTRRRVVEGIPARIVGLILILPLPLSFVAGALLAANSIVSGQDLEVESKDFQLWARLVEAALVLLCLVAAFTVAFVCSHPPAKKPRFEDDWDDGRAPQRRRLDDEAEDSLPPPRDPPDFRFRE